MAQARPHNQPDGNRNLVVGGVAAAVVVILILWFAMSGGGGSRSSSGASGGSITVDAFQSMARGRWGLRDVHAKDMTGRTMAHYAADEGRINILEWLRQQGADLNAVDNGGLTPLGVASQSSGTDSEASGRRDAARNWLQANGFQ